MVDRAARQDNGFYRFRKFEEPEDIFLEDLRGACWGRKILWKHLAETANLATNTVRRFANGETRRPTFHTIYRLSRALGFVLTRQDNVVPIKRRKK